MSEKINYTDLKKIISAKGSASAKEVDTFLAAFDKVFLQALTEDGSVRINGLGTFTRKTVAARRSVNVSTGEAITIDPYNKIAFAAEISFRESIASAPVEEEVKQAISDITDPIRKIGEQATEIMSILNDINAMDAKSAPTPAPTPAPEPTPQPTPTPAPAPEPEPVVEEPVVEEPIADSLPVVGPDFKSPNVEKVERIEEKVDEIKEDIREDIHEVKQEAKKKAKKVKDKGVNHPWIAAFVTIFVFILLLASLFLFVGYRFKQWVGEIHERTSARSTQVLRPAPAPVATPESISTDISDSIPADTIDSTVFNPDTTQNHDSIVVKTDAPSVSKPAETTSKPAETTSKPAETTTVKPDVPTTPVANSPKFVMPKFTDTLGVEVIKPGTYLSGFARRYYGKNNTDLWVFIFEANRGKARNPDCIQRGTELAIPKLSKEWMDLSNPQTRYTVDSLLHKYNKQRAN